MSFGLDLSNEFQKLTNGVFYPEVDLFYKLQDSFINIKHKYSKYSTAIDIIHGSKGQVKFIYNGSYISTILAGTEQQRELADMLFVVFSSHINQIRLMYLQNKKGKKPNSFKADLLQLYLLHDRCEITSSPLPDCTFNNRKILHDAILPSVGSYGVFYQENGIVDMSYYPANLVFPRSPKGKSIIRYAKYDSQYFGNKITINNFCESQGEKTLTDFGNSLVSMEIGTPITKETASFQNIIAFLNKYSPTFSQSEMSERFETAFVNDNGQNILGGVSTVYILNADMLCQ